MVSKGKTSNYVYPYLFMRQSFSHCAIKTAPFPHTNTKRSRCNLSITMWISSTTEHTMMLGQCTTVLELQLIVRNQQFICYKMIYREVYGFRTSKPYNPLIHFNFCTSRGVFFLYLFSCLKLFPYYKLAYKCLHAYIHTYIHT